MPVSKVDETTYSIGKITKLLHNAYQQEVKKYLARIKAAGHST
jgi:hypothetical protein